MMNSLRVLDVHDYNGKLVTESERLLCEYINRRNERLKREELLRQSERDLLIRSVNGLTNIIGSAHETDKVKEKEKETVNNISSDITVNVVNNPNSSKDKLELTNRSTENLIKDGSNHKTIRSKETKSIDIITNDNSGSHSEIKTNIINKITNNISESIDEKPSSEIIADRDDSLIFKKIIKKQRIELDDAMIVTSISNNDDFDKLPTLLCIHSNPWHAITSINPLELRLQHFGFNRDHSNVLITKLDIPANCKRWSMNIEPVDHLHHQNIFFHFNPRYFKKNEIVINDKQGTWGRTEKAHLDDRLQSRGELTLLFIIRIEAIHVFTVGSGSKNIVASFVNRRSLTNINELGLTFPAYDDNGKPEDVTVRKIWWGRSEMLENEYIIPPQLIDKLTRIYDNYRRDDFNLPIYRTLAVIGLPVHRENEDIMDLEGLLYSLFDGFEPENVNIIGSVGKGFVRLKSVEYVDEAIASKHNTMITGENNENYTLSVNKLTDLLTN